MLGTPLKLTNALHETMNQIHYNERVMRLISLAVTQLPVMEETICAATGEMCECEYKNMIVYGVADESDYTMMYMEGFSKALAGETGQTECSFDNFGDPAIGQDKHCWC